MRSTSTNDSTRILLEIYRESTIFLRYYEDGRLRFSQLAVTLTAALVGLSRLSEMSHANQRIVALCIMIIGFGGVIVTLKYSALVDRHAAISRAFRGAVSELVGTPRPGMSPIEAIYKAAASEYQRSSRFATYMKIIRVRHIWVVVHSLIFFLGLFMCMR
jgi:hypothetical protein